MRFILAFDTEDDDLGQFWIKCKSEIVDTINSKSNYTYQVLETSQLNKAQLDSTISHYKGSSFTCLAYSHGQKDSLHGKYEIYIGKQSAYLFGNSFFYTFSCHVGAELGEYLIQNDCKAFIGYLDKAQIEFNYMALFIQCVNSGFFSFLEGSNVWECFCEIRKAYDNAMDLVDNDLVAYSTFRRNRDSLCFYGNNSLTINDF